MNLIKRLQAAQLRGNTHPKEMVLLTEAAERIAELEKIAKNHVFCPDCGCDYIDDGINTIYCPYCRIKEMEADRPNYLMLIANKNRAEAALTKIAALSASWREEKGTSVGAARSTCADQVDAVLEGKEVGSE